MAYLLTLSAATRKQCFPVSCHLFLCATLHHDGPLSREGYGRNGSWQLSSAERSTSATIGQVNILRKKKW